jgi:hypothetical protein
MYGPKDSCGGSVSSGGESMQPPLGRARRSVIALLVVCVAVPLVRLFQVHDEGWEWRLTPSAAPPRLLFGERSYLRYPHTTPIPSGETAHGKTPGGAPSSPTTTRARTRLSMSGRVDRPMTTCFKAARDRAEDPTLRLKLLRPLDRTFPPARPDIPARSTAHSRPLERTFPPARPELVRASGRSAP